MVRSVSFFDLDIVAVVRHERPLLVEQVGIVGRRLDRVIRGETEARRAVEVDDPGVKHPERVALDADVAVVARGRTVGNAAARGDAGGAPAPAAVVAVFEEVVADHHVAHARLLVPEVGVSLEEDRGARDVEVALLDDDRAARAEQQAAGAVAPHAAPLDEHLGIALVGRHHMAPLDALGQRLGEGHLGVDLVDPLRRLHRAVGVGFDIVVVDQFETHSRADEVDAVLPRIAPAQQHPVGPRHPVGGHVEAVDVGRIVLLVLEHAVDHADIPAAVDEVRGVGRDADHAVLAGRRHDDEPAQLDVVAALGDDAHAAAVVEIHVANRDAAAVGQRKGGIVARRGAEHHDVAHRSRQVVAADAHAAVRQLLGRDRPARQPEIVGEEGRFATLGVELQQVGEGVDRALLVAEAQAAVDDVAAVLLGELDFEPAGARRRDDAFGVERARVVDLEVADRHVRTPLEVERRDEAREEQLRAAPLDRQIVEPLKVEGDALEALVVVADEQVLLGRAVGTQPQPAARQHEFRGADLGAAGQCGPHGGHGIALGRFGREVVGEVDDTLRVGSGAGRQADGERRAAEHADGFHAIGKG